MPTPEQEAYLLYLRSGLNVDTVSRGLAAAKEILEAVEGAISAEISQCIAECAETVGDCERCVEREIQGTLLSAADALDRCTSRIATKVGDGLADAYKSALTLGMVVPETIQAAVELGYRADVPIAEQTPSLCEGLNPFIEGTEAYKDWQDRCGVRTAAIAANPAGASAPSTAEIVTCPEGSHAETLLRRRIGPTEEGLEGSIPYEYLIASGKVLDESQGGGKVLDGDSKSYIECVPDSKYPGEEPPTPSPGPPAPLPLAECPPPPPPPRPDMFCTPYPPGPGPLPPRPIPGPGPQPPVNLHFTQGGDISITDSEGATTTIVYQPTTTTQTTTIYEGPTTTTTTYYDTSVTDKSVTTTINYLIQSKDITLSKDLGKDNVIIIHLEGGDYSVNFETGDVTQTQEQTVSPPAECPERAEITLPGILVSALINFMQPSPVAEPPPIQNWPPAMFEDRYWAVMQTLIRAILLNQDETPANLPPSIRELISTFERTKEVHTRSQTAVTAQAVVSARAELIKALKELAEQKVKEREEKHKERALIERHAREQEEFEVGLVFQQVIKDLLTPKWSDPAVCTRLKSIYDALRLPSAEILPHLLQLRNDKGAKVTPPWLDALSSALDPIGGLKKHWVNFVHFVVENLGSILSKFPAPQGCDPQQLIIPTVFKSLLGFIEKWSGADVSWFKLLYDHTQGFLCPTGLPSAEQAHEAHIAGQIDRDTWQCLIRANNQSQDWQKYVLQARQARWTEQEALRLFWRGLIPETKLDQAERERGWLDGSEAKDRRKLDEPLPGMSDIIRFMIRDVEDKDVYERFEYDKGFDKKFIGQTKDYAKWQGISEDLALRYWRSHWVLPSPTQLFQMVRLLRPEKYQTEEERKKSAVTVDDALAVLSANDIPEFWRGRILASLHPPLTRVDTRRAYNIGALTKEEVVSVYKDQGYNDKNATFLADFAEIDRKRSLRSNPIVRLFRAYGLTEDETREQLKLQGMDSATQSEAIAQARLEMAAATRQACVKALRKRYLLAEISADEAPRLIRELGFGAIEANQLADKWLCEKSAMSKTIPARKLCEWFREGLIDDNEFMVKTVALGYDNDDAYRMLQECRIIKERRASTNEEKAERMRRSQEVARQIAEELRQRGKGNGRKPVVGPPAPGESPPN